MNNKEIYHEGWLIKSPPTKRIWRARWRRRWFTLKQGEIPEQFCLEYYTDRNCRKLKGVIDLDQCEQVDCGLRLENRKQKFQYMFDIKTPKRTYYLAADTETDMRDWVNCICQVCHLHDTKQSNEYEFQFENRTQHSSSAGLTNSTQNTTTTSLHSSSSGAAATSSTSTGSTRNFAASDILRRNNATNDVVVIEQQPTTATATLTTNAATAINHSDSVYVNTEYSNRETMLCDGNFDQQHLLSAAQQQPPPSPATALYLNHSALIQAQVAAAAAVAAENARLAINSNGVVRKIPENLVLNNQPLADTQQSQSVQASPALSTASGPYIPISECFSGSPKFLPDCGTNPTTPLNNLDPKFYDTPRSHNNIGLNLTNDQSYSPKITNCSLQQLTNNTSTKNRSTQRSDSDSESVFTDDDEWTHPMPLRENVDRSTRPSDSSIENESFVLTYSQRFSKLPDDLGNSKMPRSRLLDSAAPGTPPAVSNSNETTAQLYGNTLDKLAKVLKNKNNLILDFKDNEKVTRDLPQLSDTENTSPAIVTRNANSVIDESYDIPRSHQLPYYNMGQLLEKVISPHTNPIAASTPNLMAGLETNGCLAAAAATPLTGSSTITAASPPPSSVRTLPRQHCYTNAAPSKTMEGNVFRYDFMDPSECPPVNRKLKPKSAQQTDENSKVSSSGEDKPPEEFPAKPPTVLENLANKFINTNLHSPATPTTCADGNNGAMRPPSVDRKCKPNAFRHGNNMSATTRRSAGVPHSMVLPHETEGAIGGVGTATGNNVSCMETRTLPRQPRTNYATAITTNIAGSPQSPSLAAQHQRTASAAAAMPLNTVTTVAPVPLPPKQNTEHKLQYFDLDVSNKPTLNRQSMSVGNLYTSGNPTVRLVGLSAADAAATRVPQESGVVYNFVDFVKTEAFKRIREERKKESECGVNNANK